MTAVSCTVRRRLAWMDTDAAGIWHHSTVIRLAEEAETELHRRLGIQHLTVGVSPRVHIEFDFMAPVRFDEEVATTIAVAAVGNSSVTYSLDVRVEDREIARGSVTTALVDRTSGRAVAIPGCASPSRTGRRPRTDRSVDRYRPVARCRRPVFSDSGPGPLGPRPAAPR